MDWMDETHGKQHELRFQFELGSGDFLHSLVQPDAVEGRDSAVDAR